MKCRPVRRVYSVTSGPTCVFVSIVELGSCFITERRKSECLGLRLVGYLIMYHSVLAKCIYHSDVE